MKRFLKEIIFFTIILIVSYTIIYNLTSYFFCKTDTSNSIYLYGDSQMFQGIDLNYLKDRTQANIYSAARHGAGIYDFLFFTEKVPTNSKIILSISEHSQIRPPKNEANTSPIHLKSMIELYNFNYSIHGFKNILSRGIKFPNSYYFKTSHKLYPVENSINYHTSLSSFFNRYSTITKERLLDKQDMYLKGLEKLISKNCDITFIEFPYHKALQNIEERTRYNKYFNLFRDNILKKNSNFEMDTLKLESKKNIMYDYTHLNELGARILTKKLINKSLENKSQKVMHLKFTN
ncbi:hypothetical protein [uncultured Algibacter sp.]|uniref:hypothetical protein n=1 Tax=uncultured Algibacter sp. TaxID=298659 RepID=UPI002615757D|nr:hypothetical protein [uncultured Algibacter sp.]